MTFVSIACAARHNLPTRKMGPVLLPQDRASRSNPQIAAGEPRDEQKQAPCYAALASLQLAQGISCGARLITFVKRTNFQSPGLLPKA